MQTFLVKKCDQQDMISLAFLSRQHILSVRFKIILADNIGPGNVVWNRALDTLLYSLK